MGAAEASVHEEAESELIPDDLSVPAIFKGHIGQLLSVKGYIPRDDRSHLRLGIKLEGMGFVLQRVGFLVERNKYDSDVSRRWAPLKEYQRPSTLHWLDQKEVCGYDLCVFIRQWLNDNGHSQHSLCEVVLLDDRFEDLREYVGIANAFFSHMQREPIAKPWGPFTWDAGQTLAGLKDAENYQLKWKRKIWWLDYFCLRQALSGDFDVFAVVQLIREIRCFVAHVGKRGDDGDGVAICAAYLLYVGNVCCGLR